MTLDGGCATSRFGQSCPESTCTGWSFAARQIGVAGVAIVEDPLAEQGFRDLDHIGVRYNVAKDVRGEGGRILLDVTPKRSYGVAQGHS